MLRPSMISRSPNDEPPVDQQSAGGSSSRLSAGPPPAPLRSAPNSSNDSPADQNTLAMLGRSPLSDTQNGGAVGMEGGGPAIALRGLSAMISGAQMVSMSFPGFVPAEVALWLQNAMGQLPLLIQQQQSAMGSMGMAAGAGAPMAAAAPQMSAPQPPSGAGPSGAPMPLPM